VSWLVLPDTRGLALLPCDDPTSCLILAAMIAQESLAATSEGLPAHPPGCWRQAERRSP
jgi:hypothetical protein